VYNGQKFVAQAIESLLSQTFEDFELIICDNASTDTTEAICRGFARTDRRVRYSRNAQNLGAAQNFNRTFYLSRGRYFKWAAADDVHAPEYLEQCVAVLDADPGVCLSHSETLVIDAVGRPLPKPDRCTPAHQLFAACHESCVADCDDDDCIYDPPRRLDSPLPHERFREILVATRWCFEIFGLMRRECVADTALHESYYGSDKVLLSAMALKGRFSEVPVPLFHRRYHAGTSTSLRSARARELWMNPKAANTLKPSRAASVSPRLQCLQGYCKSIANADHLNVAEQARCFAAVASYLVRFDRWAAVMKEQDERSEAL
jgi:glycosyltransferase involved in cell wall biosynthesis